MEKTHNLAVVGSCSTQSPLKINNFEVIQDAVFTIGKTMGKHGNFENSLFF